MKKLFYIMLLIQKVLFANENGFIWPVKNSYIGENVIKSPSNMSFNKNMKKYLPNFIYEISGTENTEVLAVADGEVISYNYFYQDKPSFIYGSDNFEEIKKYAEMNKGELKWISYSLGLKISSNEIVWYSGLNPNDIKDFKEGVKLKQGDVIGSIGHHFPIIDIPSFHISYTINGKFGDIQKKITGEKLPYFSENKITENFKYKLHPIGELKNNLQIIYDSLNEMHPSLYEYTDKNALLNLYTTIDNSLNTPLTSDQFYKLVYPLIQSIKDNHTYIKRDYKYDSTSFNYISKTFLPIDITVINNKAYLVKDYKNDIAPGTEILEINNIKISDLIESLKKIMTIGSGNILEWQNELLKNNFEDYLILFLEPKQGESFKLKYSNNNERIYTYALEDNKLQSSNSKLYEFKILSNNIEYFKIKGMSLTEVDKDKIKSYFSNINKESSIIIDLRNNMGGEIKDTYFLYSLFTKKDFIPEIERKVNRNDEYENFKYSYNYSADLKLYTDFYQIDNKEGYYKTFEKSPVYFDTITPIDKPLKNDVYVLTNGITGSAATRLASYFKYFSRGQIIGTEGCGNFYSMNALDFTQIRLGDLGLTLNIPLVKTTSNFKDFEGIPKDRGVIPDYIVKQSIQDYINSSDVVLEKALELIMENNKNIIIKKISISMFVGFILIITIIIYVKRNT